MSLLYPASLVMETTEETFQQSEKQNWFRYTLKSSGGIYES